MNRTLLEEALGVLRHKTVLVVGDFFLDEYLWINRALSEVSLETGLEAYQVVRRERMPGAAGTVVNNLCALEVGSIQVLGVCGADGEGMELRRALAQQGVDVSALLEWPHRFTPTYIKPLVMGAAGGQELNRLDLKNRAPLPGEIEHILVETLRFLVPQVDAVVVCDQVQERDCGTITGTMRSELATLSQQTPSTLFFADSRVRIGEFIGLITKPNEHEISALFEIDPPCSPTLPLPTRSLEELAAMGQELSRRTGKPVFLTCGARGILYCTVLDVTLVPALPVDGPVDIVGAGDSATAGIIGGLSAGAVGTEAAALGCLAASITVRKLGTTGTASAQELREIVGDATAGLQSQPVVPEWQKRRIIGNGVEIIRSSPPGPIKAAIFDFDGTLSLIREGWQDVMIPFMVEELAGLGTGEDEEILSATVREYVFRLTGKQTIYQMFQLADEIRRRSGSPQDPQVYKQRYHDLLWDRIQERVAGLKSGAIRREQMLVPGSLQLLEALRKRGVQLYLASGTDIEYVQDEAAALGVAEYFGENIYAALHEVEQFSKKMVIQQIIRDHELAGPELIAFGDGYVEIENAREAGGRAVGTATDEANPGRLDRWKRNRLIAAGADVIIANFTEADVLLPWLTEGLE